MNIVNDILVNTLFTDTDFVQTLEMNSVVPKYVENQEKGNPSVCKNCAEAPLKDLHIYGRSEQMTTTGAQLLDLDAISLATGGGATSKRLDDGGFLVDGTPKKAYEQYTEKIAINLAPGTYFVSGGRYADGCAVAQINILNADGTKKYKSNASFDVLGTEQEITLIIQSVSEKPINNYKIYPMINSGSVALPFEPYTGGKPSPSPEYPQEIVNAGKDGNLNVMVRGKNLLELTDTKVQNNNLKIDINKGSITFSGTADGASFIHKIKDFVVPRDGIYTISTNSDDSINESPRILISVNGAALENAFAGVTKELSTGSVISLYIRVSAAGSYNGRMIKPMIEKNSEGTVYEPYHEPQSMPVTTPNGLPGIPVAYGGNYTDENGQQWICDEVDLGRGVYVQRIASFVINAKNANDIFVTNLYTHVTVAVNARIRTPEETSNSLEVRSNRNLFCEALPWIADEWSSTVNSMGFVENGMVDFTVENSYLGLNAASTNDERKAALVKYFTDKPCQIIYRIATPIETPLTTAEIAAYKSLRTYRGTTFVEAEDKAGISVKYNMPMPKLSKNGALRRWFKRHPII